MLSSCYSMRGMTMEKLYSEWFWSEASARGAAERAAKKVGGVPRWRYAMRADGRHDWIAEVFAA
ncbi:hypothetical protein BM43_7601 (plasmid) [Burkholderia gladioli]|uniref:Uncharacterized protein n=2 Tax=Burkholderia gladioli TaxID=28095 RepID=A0AAW3FAL1_BURGA|nr:hypothetical protein BM43_7601 [Burkholderia gladioli]KGC24039.1 hypothetical protein DM48_8005 [Burkholderia gladioli]